MLITRGLGYNTGGGPGTGETVYVNVPNPDVDTFILGTLNVSFANNEPVINATVSENIPVTLVNTLGDVNITTVKDIKPTLVIKEE